MSTDTRPELSKKSKYWIPKHRYYERKRFVLQYDSWQAEVSKYDSMVRSGNSGIKLLNTTDPTGDAVAAREEALNKIKLITATSVKTDPILGRYVVMGILKNCSYDALKCTYDIPCGRYTYYDLYHKFFWLLDSARK